MALAGRAGRQPYSSRGAMYLRSRARAFEPGYSRRMRGGACKRAVAEARTEARQSCDCVQGGCRVANGAMLALSGAQTSVGSPARKLMAASSGIVLRLRAWECLAASSFGRVCF